MNVQYLLDLSGACQPLQRSLGRTGALLCQTELGKVPPSFCQPVKHLPAPLYGQAATQV